MSTSLDTRCRRCGRPHAVEQVACSSCGELGSRAEYGGSPRARNEQAPSRVVGARDIRSAGRALHRDPRVVDAGFDVTGAARAPTTIVASRAAVPWLHLGLGAAASVVFLWLPFTAWMCWFLSALVHEMGHAACAWFLGMPAMPVISLAGEAAAVHEEQSTFLVLCVAAALVGLARRFLVGHARWIAIAVALPLYLAIAFTDGKEFFHLLAGHGGELAFAGVCLFRALDGGFTETPTERVVYAMLAWAILARNVSLCFGLATNGAARAEYAGSGSFGLTNDYLRVAHDVLNCSLPTVAVGMLLAAACVAPLAFLAWRWRSRADV